MQLFQPYYVRDEAHPLCHHFVAVCNASHRVCFSWNESEVVIHSTQTLETAPNTHRYTVPSHLLHVVDLLLLQLGPVTDLRVHYMGHYSRYLVSKIILLNETESLRYSATLRIFPTGTHQVEVVTGYLRKYRTAYLPTMVLNCFQTINASDIQEVLAEAATQQDIKSRNHYILNHLRPLCSICHPHLDAGVARALQLPLVSVSEYHSLLEAPAQ